jgi:hypothetical protein
VHLRELQGETLLTSLAGHFTRYQHLEEDSVAFTGFFCYKHKVYFGGGHREADVDLMVIGS